MLRQHRFRIAGLLLVLIIALVVGLDDISPSGAQSGPAVDVKADRDLRRAYQLFRRQNGFTLNATRQRDRDAIRNQIGVEDRDGRTVIGVTIKLREASEAAYLTAQSEIEAAGFRLGSRIGNIATTSATADDLPRLAEIAFIETIHSARYNYAEAENIERLTVKSKAELKRRKRLMNDLVNQAVQAPQARSTYNVTGKGIIVGLIDSGVDFRHGDFRNANGTTRIKAYWDLSAPDGTGPNGIGRVYTEAEINQTLQGSGPVAAVDTSGHGSHVAGIAAGNGLGAGPGSTADSYRGIAPEADLVICKASRAGSNGYRQDDLINAMSWMRDQAAAFNEPISVNMSIGGQVGNRDGSDPQEIAIDNFVGSGEMRQFATSAGNTGSRNNHAGGVIAQGTEVTLPFIMDPNSFGVQLIYHGSDNVSASVIKPNNTVIGPVTFGNAITSDSEIALSNEPSGTSNNAKHIYVDCNFCSSGTWKLVLKGEAIRNGRYDAWSMDTGNTFFDSSVADLVNETGSPKGVKRANVVANFISRSNWTDVDGALRTRTSQGLAGNNASSSSGGPSRDGRLKPNLAAPGTYVLSTLSVSKLSTTANSEIGVGGKHYINFGTSMASPVVTGTVALMLQAAKDRGRTLGGDTIRRLLQRSVKNDSFTGATISYKYGYGKVNTFEAVKAVVDNVYATEFVSVNAASFASDSVAAPETILAGFGPNLAGITAAATTLPLPTVLGGVSVRITDQSAQPQLAPLFFVSPNQINYQIPPGIAQGVAQVEVIRDGSVVARGAVSINAVWPGLFTVNSFGTGTGAANVLRLRGSQLIYESPTTPIDLGIQGDQVFLVLYGSGLRGRSALNKVSVWLGGTKLNVDYAGAQGSLAGLDQINVPVPTTLAGRGQLDLIVYIDGWVANTIQFTIR